MLLVRHPDRIRSGEKITALKSAGLRRNVVALSSLPPGSGSPTRRVGPLRLTCHQPERARCARLWTSMRGVGWTSHAGQPLGLIKPPSGDGTLILVGLSNLVHLIGT